MFQNNPILSQLKQQIRDSQVWVEGTVKGTDKAYGFLDSDKKSYFIPPTAMKKVMHGDKIKAVIETVAEDREQAEPKELVEPMLSRFVAKVRWNKDRKLTLLVDHPLISQPIMANLHKSVEQKLKDGDWVVAILKTHPLRDDRLFFAQVIEFICSAEDQFAPWWVTLARHQQSRYPVQGAESYQMLDQQSRQDLTALFFVTIDSANTQDMDDALYIEPIKQDSEQTGWKLVVAIADPTAYIAIDSQIEKDAAQRCFTHYLPGFNVPMLPRELSDDLCSLMPNEKRPALVCYIETDLAGNIIHSPYFVSAYVQSKAKLTYDGVSDYLDNVENSWQPENTEIKQQIENLHQFALARIQWRKNNALLFKEKPDYAFELAENGNIINIKAEHRRIAHKIVEEAMVIANICAAEYLAEKVKCGIFSKHLGFDPKHLSLANEFLLTHIANDQSQEALAERYSVENLSILTGYCDMQRDLEQQQNNYVQLRLRRLLQPAEFSSEIAPHFGMGLNGYATWTSPIRKYSDMVNHRLIKATIIDQQYDKPQPETLKRLQEARRQNRLVERDIADWLYCRYLAENMAKQPHFEAEIVDIMRGGLRVQLLENGAFVFIPAPMLHNNKEEMQYNAEQIAMYIRGEKVYQLGDLIRIKLIEVRENTRSIVGDIAV